MIYNNKLNYIKIHLIELNKLNKEIVMIQIKIEIEIVIDYKITNNKNVYAIEIYLIPNGYNAVTKRNVGAPIGIIYSVQGLKAKT